MSVSDWWSPCYVYRYYSESGAPLYFGHTKTPEARDAQHVRNSAWRADAAMCTLSGPMSRLEAMAEEARLISEERPAHNIAHAKSPKLSRDTLTRLNYARAHA